MRRMRLKGWGFLSLGTGALLCCSVGCISSKDERKPSQSPTPMVKTMGPGNASSPAYANVDGKGPAGPMTAYNPNPAPANIVQPLSMPSLPSAGGNGRPSYSGGTLGMPNTTQNAAVFNGAPPPNTNMAPGAVNMPSAPSSMNLNRQVTTTPTMTNGQPDQLNDLMQDPGRPSSVMTRNAPGMVPSAQQVLPPDQMPVQNQAGQNYGGQNIMPAAAQPYAGQNMAAPTNQQYANPNVASPTFANPGTGLPQPPAPPLLNSTQAMPGIMAPGGNMQPQPAMMPVTPQGQIPAMPQSNAAPRPAGNMVSNDPRGGAAPSPQAIALTNSVNFPTDMNSSVGTAAAYVANQGVRSSANDPRTRPAPEEVVPATVIVPPQQ